MKIFNTFLLLTFFVPCIALACSTNGFTVIYVNGILTSSEQADSDLQTLQRLLGASFEGQPLKIYNGYNPSHLDGAGDILEAISQAFNTPLSDYDLDTILTQIEPEVTTQKLLLVGHSQGAFYTNEIYGYLIANGVSPRSIAVYNLATPASYVAGNGNYLTSDNDKVINYVRKMDAAWGAPQALSANTSVAEESGYADNAWGGHLPDVYFNGAPSRIVSDIDTALSGLVATDTLDACFTPPKLGLSYVAEQAALTIADPAVADVQYAAVDTRSTLASVSDNANDILHTEFLDAYFSVFPKPDVQSAAGVFAVEKALYGSSMSVADYEALANGEDIPEVQTPAQDPPPAQPRLQPSEPQVQPIPQVQTLAKPVQATPPNPPKADSVAPTSTPGSISISPGFGGGSRVGTANAAISTAQGPEPIASSSSQEQTVNSTSSTSTDPSENIQQFATTTIPLSILSPADQTTFSTTSIAFTGTTSPSALVFANFGATSTSTVADGEGNWSTTLELPAGTTTILLSAADPSGEYSATSTLTIGVTLPPPATTLPAIAVTCPNFEGGGYFFDPSYMQVEYVGGLLRIHLRLLAPYNDGRAFHATAIINGSNCISLSANFGTGPAETWLPANLQYYSFRMSTPTHWILWDDEHDVQATCDVCEGDIPADVISVSFTAMIGSGASTLTTYPYPPTDP